MYQPGCLAEWMGDVQRVDRVLTRACSSTYLCFILDLVSSLNADRLRADPRAHIVAVAHECGRREALVRLQLGVASTCCSILTAMMWIHIAYDPSDEL